MFYFRDLSRQQLDDLLDDYYKKLNYYRNKIFDSDPQDELLETYKDTYSELISNIDKINEVIESME